MALTDFFRINLPYGIKRNANDEWIAFNREYMPLGWNSSKDVNKTVGHNDNYEGLSLYTKYQNLTEAKLIKLASGEGGIKRDEKGKIYMVFLYDTGTVSPSHPQEWTDYIDKIKILADLKVNGQY